MSTTNKLCHTTKVQALSTTFDNRIKDVMSKQFTTPKMFINAMVEVVTVAEEGQASAYLLIVVHALMTDNVKTPITLTPIQLAYHCAKMVSAQGTRHAKPDSPISRAARISTLTSEHAFNGARRKTINKLESTHFGLAIIAFFMLKAKTM